ncbi:unnamed protein product [Cylindrotheca closterium]|uniref:Uncharacterized protein n=1 Tax=Cylindrotheca closterium TaxID=2856 RepID=A0AAD2CEG5_9STRA|nr:unnamed protein product [Cylindrotheca closterium]
MFKKGKQALLRRGKQNEKEPEHLNHSQKASSNDSSHHDSSEHSDKQSADHFADHGTPNDGIQPSPSPEESDFRWSIKPDARLSDGAIGMKSKKQNTARNNKMTMLGATPEGRPHNSSDDSGDDPYLTSDDDNMHLGAPLANHEEVPTEEDPTPVPIEEEEPTTVPIEESPTSEDSIQKEEMAPKKRKKKKKSGISTSSRSSGGSKKRSEDVGISNSSRSTKSKKAKTKKLKKDGVKKTKKKKKKAGEDSEGLEVEAPKKKSSLKDRFRASLAMIGGGSAAQTKDLDKEIIAAIEEDGSEQVEDNDTPDSPLVDSTSVEPETITEKEQSSPSVESETVTEKEKQVSRLTDLVKGGGAPANGEIAPKEQIREGAKRMKAMQTLRSCAVDTHFSAAFSSEPDKSVSAGLMSESDKDTVDKMLAELRQYEIQLEQERNQLIADRDMLQLQQESVEHLLEEETQKAQQLEARVSELENILESEVYRKENEELMMKVQLMETELKRQEDSLAKMVADKQEVMKRQNSTSTERTSSIVSNWDSADLILDGSEVQSEKRSSSLMTVPGDAKLQGELLQLRSSLNHKDNALEEQAKEIAKLKEQLEQSDENQKLSQVEAACEEFRNESKENRSEVERLKKQLAKVEAEKQAEIIKGERWKQLEEEKTKALREAEYEKNEALKKLDTHLLLNLKTTKTRESTINNVLDIGTPAQYATTTPTEIIEETDEIEESEFNDSEKQEKTNWFGRRGKEVEELKGIKKKRLSIEEAEELNWFGFGGDGDDKVQEKDDNAASGWFGFGGKEKKDDRNENSGFFGFGKKGNSEQVIAA